MEKKTKTNKAVIKFLKPYATGMLADELNRRLALRAGKHFTVNGVKVLARFYKVTDAELEAELARRQPGVSVNAKLNESACPVATAAEIVAACPPFVKSAATGLPVRNTVAGILGSWASRGQK